MSFSVVTESLLNGFLVTLSLFFFTLILSLPLGLAIAFGSMSKIKPVKYLFKIFVWIIRGVPLMLQLFIVYFLPGILTNGQRNFWATIENTFYFNFGISDAGPYIATLIAFVINYACYFSEIYRGGIESISKGQYEAGCVLGMTKSQIFFKIVLLQVVKRILAPISNEVITLVKDTALARVIGVVEIICQAELMANKIIWPLFYTGAFYLVVVGIFTVVFNLLEKKLDYFKA